VTNLKRFTANELLQGKEVRQLSEADFRCTHGNPRERIKSKPAHSSHFKKERNGIIFWRFCKMAAE
jgi:hypothetical protein